ncbi:unnamed protein product [Lactuca virosa]|uniref:Uncharacterized protein n=1 Tax=Lactuca virosa TaxID=75947 RepID=A0AAU9MDY4_9ASTR|nr:unnamed protein product [Lactuca virosa]
MDLCRGGRNRGDYASQFNQLHDDMITTTTIHKLMGLLMTGGGHGGARVVQEDLPIGETVEHKIIRREYIDSWINPNEMLH